MAPPDTSQTLVELITRVKSEWPPGKWEWDAQFQCALTTLKKDAEAQGRAVLSASLPGVWTNKTLATAPTLAQQVCNQTGGLKGQQLLFSADLGSLVAYCLWWPWGDGNTFSIRLGALSNDASRDLKPELRRAFGI